MRENAVVELAGPVDDLDKALRTLKKKCERGGVFMDMRRHQFYLKPSDARRSKEAKARRKARKAATWAARDLERDDKRWNPTKGNGYR
jgi:small subunit ribosomal protein S21